MRSSPSAASLSRRSASCGPPDIDAGFLESLIGYNARRAAILMMGTLTRKLAPHALSPVDFSVLSLVLRNPGVTSRQLCRTLEVLPPNLVGIVTALEARGLVERQPHPGDRRAAALRLSENGERLMQEIEPVATQSDIETAARLTPAEQKALIRLLKKIWL